LALGYAPASAFTFTFDENGNGVFNGSPLIGSLQPDPSNGGAVALTYFLPSGFTPVVTGTVRVLDPDGTLSDAIRFTDSLGRVSGTLSGDRMLFYSKADDGDLADTGFPSNLTTGSQAVPVTEINGVFTYFAEPNTYTGISDRVRVPEPASLLLLA